jgi:hypothetical protein
MSLQCRPFRRVDDESRQRELFLLHGFLTQFQRFQRTGLEHTLEAQSPSDSEAEDSEHDDEENERDIKMIMLHVEHVLKLPVL